MRNDQSHLLKFMVELKEGGMMRSPGTSHIGGFLIKMLFWGKRFI